MRVWIRPSFRELRFWQAGQGLGPVADPQGYFGQVWLWFPLFLSARAVFGRAGRCFYLYFSYCQAVLWHDGFRIGFVAE